MTKVKVCGITCVEDLLAAVEEGTDALGFVVGVPTSPRNLDLLTAQKLFSKVPIFVTSVLVTVWKSQEFLAQLCKSLQPNAVQIHGKATVPPATLEETTLNAGLIRAVNVNHYNEQDGKETMAGYDAVLGDSGFGNKEGGTGRVHDWILSKRIREELKVPFILAGGLTSDNVAAAISTVKPYAVDVSTGVESSPGRKDRVKMSLFMKNAKETG